MFSNDGEFRRHLARARDGEGDVIWRLLACSRQYLLFVANRKLSTQLRPKADPADLVEEALLVAHRGFPQFRGATAREWFLWLRQVLAHVILNFARRFAGTARRDVRREVAYDQLPVAKRTARRVKHWFAARTVTPSYEAMAVERAQAVQAAIGRLPKVHQQLLHLRHHDGMKFHQIGAVLGCTADSARRLWGRVICQLSREL
jgi:RNA polymerase sigma-70 factor, ECF subfamily